MVTGDHHREAIAEVLAGHEPFGGGWFCTCIPEGEDGVREFLEPSWEAHLADALLGSDVLAQIRAEARAEAWDEGRAVERMHARRLADYHHWSSISTGPPTEPPNPYRAEGSA